MLSYKAILNRIKTVKFLKTDAEVARVLGIEPGTLAASKYRNSIPFKMLEALKKYLHRISAFLFPRENPTENPISVELARYRNLLLNPEPCPLSPPPEYYSSQDYYLYLGDKIIHLFKLEREHILITHQEEDSEQFAELRKVDDILEEVAMLQYLDRPMIEKIWRLEEVQSLFLERVRKRAIGY